MRLWIKLLMVFAAWAVGVLVVTSNARVPMAEQVSIPTLAAIAVPPTLDPIPTQQIPTGAIAGVTEGREEATIIRVVDGDTVELSDGSKLRYIGIDTPETVHPTKPVQCIGPEATKKNRDLVEGRQVELEKDVSETDRLGRLLRYVYVDGVMVNEVLVQEGFAESSKYPPDTKHQARLDEAERSAQLNKWGIWSSLCAGTTPTPPYAPEVSNNGECAIKGNINSDNEKIYHLPGCGSYEKTNIDEARGEQYFCTEEEARSGGWRKAGNC